MSDLFGRIWKLQILLNNSSVMEIVAEDPTENNLKVRFDVSKMIGQAYWYADIDIYNLSHKYADTLITDAMQVVFSAGYKGDRYGEIFRGTVMQPLWDRENVVDFRLTLHCIVGKLELTENFIAGTRAAMMSQDDIVRWMAANCYKSLPVETLAKTLQKTKMPRGQVFFGDPRKYLDYIAQANRMQWWLSPNGINMGDVTQTIANDQALVISTDSGLIGTPQQTQEGVVFRVLLDPRIVVRAEPFMQVQLDNNLTRQRKRMLGELPSWMDMDGIYNVGRVRHVGDTRGNDWYTEVTGFTPAFGKAGILADVN